MDYKHLSGLRQAPDSDPTYQAHISPEVVNFGTVQVCVNKCGINFVCRNLVFAIVCDFPKYLVRPF